MVSHRLVKVVTPSREKTPDRIRVMQRTIQQEQNNPAQYLQFSLYSELQYRNCYNEVLRISDHFRST